MSNPQTEQEQIELETIETEHNFLIGEALNRLRKNPDFQLVIENGYLRDKVLASFSLLAVPQIKKEGHRPDIMEDLVAGSNLKYYFAMIDNAYEGCVNPILSDEEEEALIAEQNDGVK